MGTRVSIQHADSNPDLVTVNHVNPGAIPNGQTGRTSGGAWTNLGHRSRWLRLEYGSVQCPPIQAGSGCPPCDCDSVRF